MKILVVDDSRAMRKLVMRTLEKAGYGAGVHQLCEAVNGAAALRQIRETEVPPDLVLSDWNMPAMTGIELLQAVRKDGRQNIRFGFITSEGTNDIRQMAQESGAEFLLAKPFTVDSFRTALKAVLG